MEQSYHKAVIDELIKILDIAILYGCPGGDKYKRQLMSLDSQAIIELVVKETFTSIQPYRDVLKKKDYSYFSKKRGNRINLADKDMSDFLSLTWDDVTDEHRAKVFRSMAKIYNYCISSSP